MHNFISIFHLNTFVRSLACNKSITCKQNKRRPIYKLGLYTKLDYIQNETIYKMRLYTKWAYTQA